MLITGDPYTFLLILSLHSKQRSQFSPCIVSPSLPSKTPSLSANVRRRLSDDSTSEQVFTKSHKRTVSHNPKTTVGGMPSASPEKRKMSVFSKAEQAEFSASTADPRSPNTTATPRRCMPHVPSEEAQMLRVETHVRSMFQAKGSVCV